MSLDKNKPNYMVEFEGFGENRVLFKGNHIEFVEHLKFKLGRKPRVLFYGDNYVSDMFCNKI